MSGARRPREWKHPHVNQHTNMFLARLPSAMQLIVLPIPSTRWSRHKVSAVLDSSLIARGPRQSRSSSITKEDARTTDEGWADGRMDISGNGSPRSIARSQPPPPLICHPQWPKGQCHLRHGSDRGRPAVPASDDTLVYRRLIGSDNTALPSTCD